ncbi:MAG: hypothetical protein IPN78_19185 [Candidatus Accumulibacter sp.]|nr:hypothetical protein [Candidatus Accumulibacter propinquus]
MEPSALGAQLESQARRLPGVILQQLAQGVHVAPLAKGRLSGRSREINLRVDAGRLGVMVPQHAAGFAQGGTVPERVGGQRMPKLMASPGDACRCRPA